MKVEKKLLPLKLHYFLFNAGMGCLNPYLSTIIRQLGFTAGTFGSIYAVLSIFGLLTKLLNGLLLNGLLEKFKIQKLIFILFQIVTTVSLAMIYFVPRLGSAPIVDLECYAGLFYLKSCYSSAWMLDQCKVRAASESEDTAECHMHCSMSSPHAWHAICESWHLREYCNTKEDILDYTTHLGKVTLLENCAYISANSVTLDGHIFTPHCNVGDDITSRLHCDDETLSGMIGKQTVTMTCLGNIYSYRICGSDTILSQLPTNINSECKVTCSLNPWRLLQICEEWKSFGTETCRARKKVQDRLPTNLSLIGHTQLTSTISENECVYSELSIINIADDSDHQSSCSNETAFQIPCETRCDNNMLYELFLAASDSTTITTQSTKQLVYLFILMIYGWVGQIMVLTLADVLYFNLAGQEVPQYGKQRLWGSVGRGISTLLTGFLIDAFSDGEYKDYAVAFVLMLAFMTGDIIVSCFLKNETTKTSKSIQTDVDTRIFSTPYGIFIFWAVAVGICSGVWQFLLWYLEDIASYKDPLQSRCNGLVYIKTLQGLVSAIQAFCGELPFVFGFINRLGHLNVMSIMLVAFGGRFILYSFLTVNPWWILPIELMYSDTSGIFYYMMAPYTNEVSPSGAITTVLGSIGVVAEAVGASLGSSVGGYLLEKLRGQTYLFFGIGSLVSFVLMIGLQSCIKHNGHTQELDPRNTKARDKKEHKLV